MAEEFDESEVIFSDRDNFHSHNYYLFDKMCNNRNNHRRNLNSSKKKQQHKKKSCPASVPVTIPASAFKLSDSDEYDAGDEIVPPHVVIGRRIEGKMAFSVCTGNGRTLKGRDLSQVRNSILRLTGFLEA